MTTYFKLMSIVIVLIIASATISSSSTTRHPIITLDGQQLVNDSIINNYFSNNITILEKDHRSSDEFPFTLFTEEQRRHGAIIINILVSLYGFIFIAFVCQDYFLPSMLCICSDLGISPDVAGATFMAIASCMTEMIISIIGTFVTKSDIAIGTTVGGGVYNTLAVPACVALAANRPIAVEKWPLLRDSIVYAMSVTVLAVIAIDNIVVWYEAIIMVIMYLGYFLFLLKQEKFVETAVNLKSLFQPRTGIVVCNYFKQLFNRKPTSTEYQNIATHKMNKQPIVLVNQYGTMEHKTTSVTITSAMTNETRKIVEEPCSRCFHSTDNCLENIWLTFCLPVTFVLSITIPDCRINEKRYPFTFVVSIIWISVIAYILSWMITICGDTFHISDNVMGIVVLAAGNSVPEIIMGIINSQKGEGSMSISNALGSNTMSILMCLGLPWFVKTCILPTSMNGGPVLIMDKDELFNCACMIVSVFILDAAAVIGDFQIYRSFGIICLVGQVAIMAVLIVNCLHQQHA